MNSEAHKVHYDRLASRYDAMYRSEECLREDAIVRNELLRAGVEKSGCILDLGCGTGLLLEMVVPERYVGVDISKGMLEIAETRHGDQLGRVFRLGRIEDEFGYHSFVAALYMSPNFVHDLSYLTNRVEKGGTLVAVSYNAGYDGIASFAEDGDALRVMSYTENTLRRELRKRGMHVERLRGITPRNGQWPRWLHERMDADGCRWIVVTARKL